MAFYLETFVGAGKWVGVSNKYKKYEYKSKSCIQGETLYFLWQKKTHFICDESVNE